MQDTDLPLPSAYTLLLSSLDGLQDKDSVETNTTSITDELIILDVVPSLPIRRLWNCTILAYGCRTHSIVNDFELSELNHAFTCMNYFYAFLCAYLSLLRVLYKKKQSRPKVPTTFRTSLLFLPSPVKSQ